MGDLRVCYPNGDISREDPLCPSSPFSLSLSNPDQLCSIGRESWDSAEETTRRIVWRVQPTLDADRKRKEVVDYVQRLIQDGLGYQVFPYGSVPLKTYLPDGDIDLTTLSSPAIEDTLVTDVHSILRGEEHNQNAPYRVKDVHRIDAEVKLVKCLVQDVVVDISFNQLGGLCTLCFLEQIDRLVGKDHLFKRSIILIKAWCYYESRILGAHHGLISTYALETLVLYIFHQFHSSLNGPLAVLYRFLDYFGKFDWENYCISLNGPVCKSSLPDIVAEVPENMGDNPLLSEEFLSKCINMFSVPSKGVDTNSWSFPLKHLNIIDPLKENNNLGRSVNRGNYYRIRSALKYGARKLGQILILPRERIADELVKFFANTLERHQSNHLTGLQILPLTADARGSDHVKRTPCISTDSENILLAKPINFGANNDKISGSISASGSRYKLGCPFNILTSQVGPENKTNANRNAVSGHCHPGGATEFVLSGLLATKSKNDSSDYFPPSSNLGASLPAKPLIHRQNGRIESGNSSKSMLTESFALKPYSKHYILAASNVVCKRQLAGIFGDSESVKSLLDLTGDYDGQFWSLLYGQYCHLFSVSTPVSPHLQNENHCGTIEQSIPLKQHLYSQRDSNGILGPQLCFSRPPAAVCRALDSEDKKRGTGTYIPSIKYCPNRERPSSRKGIFQAPRTYSQFQKYNNNNNNVSAIVQQEMALPQEGSYDLSPEEYPALGPLKYGSPNTHRPYPSVWGLCAANGLTCPHERFESESSRLELQSTNMPEDNTLPNPWTCGSTASAMIPPAQSAQSVIERDQESDAGLSFHLKNEHDFPPLSL